MSERASIFEKPRIGVESTPGTPVAANLVLKSLTITPTPVIPREAIYVAGNMASVGQTGGKEYTDFSIDAPLTYSDTPFFFNSILCAPTSATTSGVTTLTWRPDAEGANSLRTYTVEVGSGSGSAGFAGAFLTDLSVSIDKSSVKITGKGMGKSYQEGITLTVNPSDVILEPASSNQVSVFVAQTLAGLDDPSARMKRCLSASFSMAGRQSALMVLDDTEQSYSASVERRFDKSAQIVVEQDSQGSGLMGALKSASLFWVRYICKGREITTGNPLTLQITFPAQIKSTSRQDNDDVFCSTWDMEPTSVTGAFATGKSAYVEVLMKVAAATATQANTAGSAPAGQTGVRPTEVLANYTALATAQPVTP